jgi:hypothetical protein
MKKIIAITLLMTIVLTVLTGCRVQFAVVSSDLDGFSGSNGEQQSGDSDIGNETITDLLPFDGKIVIITNPGINDPNTAGGFIAEDALLRAEALVVQFGQEQVVHKIWPSWGAVNGEEIIDEMFSEISEDHDVKAMIIFDSFSDSSYVIDSLTDLRDDIFLVFVIYAFSDKADYIDVRADLIIQTDAHRLGETYARQAISMGAETLAEYSFPMNRSDPVHSLRRDAIITTAEREGIRFIDLEAPTPGGGDWLQINMSPFLMQDLPRQAERLGKNTAFFGSSIFFQDLIMTQTVATGAIFVLTDHPSIFHTYPEVFEIEYRIETDQEDELGRPILRRMDVPELLQALDEAVDAAGMAGRVSCWAVPDFMMWLTIGFMYSVEWLSGNVPQERGVIDIDVLERLAREYTASLGLDAGVTLEALTHDGEMIGHYVLGVIDYYVFGS